MKITDSFWSNYLKLIKETVIPFQWDALNDDERVTVEVEGAHAPIPTEKSHAIANLRIAAGLQQGEHQGYWFQDSDVYKWLEGVGNILNHYPDPDLETLADSAIDLIEQAMEDDGYLNTYYQLRMPERKWQELHMSHEMYCCGHLIEAAVAYYQATKKDKLLKLACRFADCIDQNFGPEPHKREGTDGHQEMELALVKLFHATQEKRYLNLANYLLDIRGKTPETFAYESFYTPTYLQSYVQPKDQREALGHAVRLTYMCVGMAEVARETGDQALLSACERIWDNITTKRMYVIGGIGSTHMGEAFTYDYDLPNDTMYCETCASIGLIYFANAMLGHDPDAKYADVMERALYNNTIGGMSQEGKHYFYVNPLESVPEANEKTPTKGHVKSTRPDWFGCACCPPNLARTLSNIEKYIVTQTDDSLYTHLYIGYQQTFDVADQRLCVDQAVVMDQQMNVTLQLSADEPVTMNHYLRVPTWTKAYQVFVNGEQLTNVPTEKGYLVLKRAWQADEICLVFDQPILQITAHPKVRNNVGKVAIQRGPFVYCMEEADNGDNLHLVRLGPVPTFNLHKADWLPVPLITTTAQRQSIDTHWDNQLYGFDQMPKWTATELILIPYYAWANRGKGEMYVWMAQ